MVTYVMGFSELGNDSPTPTGKKYVIFPSFKFEN